MPSPCLPLAAPRSQPSRVRRGYHGQLPAAPPGGGAPSSAPSVPPPPPRAGHVSLRFPGTSGGALTRGAPPGAPSPPAGHAPVRSPWISGPRAVARTRTPQGRPYPAGPDGGPPRRAVHGLRGRCQLGLRSPAPPSGRGWGLHLSPAPSTWPLGGPRRKQRPEHWGMGARGGLPGEGTGRPAHRGAGSHATRK